MGQHFSLVWWVGIPAHPVTMRERVSIDPSRKSFDTSAFSEGMHLLLADSLLPSRDQHVITIVALPTEILLQIANLFYPLSDRDTLKSMCLIKPLSSVATQVLYSQIYCRNTKKSWDLLFTILEHPCLGELVRDLVFDPPHKVSSSRTIKSPKTRRLFLYHLEFFLHLNNKTHFISAIRYFEGYLRRQQSYWHDVSVDLCGALLLLYCPNIRSLKVCGQFNRDRVYLEMSGPLWTEIFLMKGLKPSSASITQFEHLRRLEIEPGERWIPELISIFHLPSLKELLITRLMMEQRLSQRALSSTESSPSNITSLSLDNCRLTVTGMAWLISMCPKLSHLHSTNGGFDDQNAPRLTLSPLAAALWKSHTTLTHLELTCSNRHWTIATPYNLNWFDTNASITDITCALPHYTALTHIKIDSRFLIGSTTPYPWPLLPALFPRSADHVTIQVMNLHKFVTWFSKRGPLVHFDGWGRYSHLELREVEMPSGGLRVVRNSVTRKLFMAGKVVFSNPMPWNVVLERATQNTE